MCKKGLDLLLALHLPKNVQYPQLTMIWWICVLIYDVVILKQFSFLLVIFFSLDISLIFPRNACFLCALCGNVTAFFFSAPNYTMKKPFWKRQVCPAFINVMIENILSHKSGDKSTLYNVVMNVFPLLSHIFIRTWSFCFAVTWCPSETSGFMWHIAPKSKIQLVNFELSPYFTLLSLSSLDIRAMDAYILWSSLFFPLSHAQLPFSLKRTCFRRF